MFFISCSGGSGHHQPSIPFLSLTNPLPQAHKPLGSKICRWVNNDGTVCGKAFSKLDSLRRHVNELHKGCRPFGCNMCDKNYGRRDYLDRHIRTHDPDNQKKNINKIDWGTSGILVTEDGKKLMPCPFTGRKMFCAGPNFLSQPKNLTAFSASSTTFVPAQKPIVLNANHLFGCAQQHVCDWHNILCSII